MHKGIDISVIQGIISQQDWELIAASDIEFCISRCGVGNDGKDSRFDYNVAMNKSVGILPGAYHFGYPLPITPDRPTRDPRVQAKVHFSFTNGEQLAILDLEWPTIDQWTRWGCSAQQIIDWTLTYLQEYEQLSGRKPLIYSYPYFLAALKPPVEFAQYPLWIASYESTPQIPHPWTNWTVWQNTGGGGKLPNGAPVDTDLTRDLSLWGISSAPLPQPTIPEINATSPSPPTPNPVAAVPNDTSPAAPQPIAPITVVNSNTLASIGNILTRLFTIFDPLLALVISFLRRRK